MNIIWGTTTGYQEPTRQKINKWINQKKNWYRRKTQSKPVEKPG